MLSINGSLQGTTYRDEIVNVDTLIDLFPETIGFLRNQQAVEFRVSANRAKNHRGQEVSTPEVQVPAFFSASYQGSNFTVRYYEAATTAAPGQGGTQYAPRSISVEFTGGRKRYSGEGVLRNKELLAFLALCPSCGTSPLVAMQSRVRFVVFDEVASANKNLTKVRQTSEVVMSVLQGTAEPFDLLNAAAGMGLNTKQPLAIIQDNMVSLAQTNASGFAERFTNEAVRMSGMATRLLENNVIIRNTHGNNVGYAVNETAAAAVGVSGIEFPFGNKPSDQMAKAALVQFLLNNDQERELFELMLRTQTGQKKAETKPAAAPRPAMVASAMRATAPVVEKYEELEEAPELVEAEAVAVETEPVIKSKRRTRKTKTS